MILLQSIKVPPCKILENGGELAYTPKRVIGVTETVYCKLKHAILWRKNASSLEGKMCISIILGLQWKMYYHYYFIISL